MRRLFFILMLIFALAAPVAYAGEEGEGGGEAKPKASKDTDVTGGRFAGDPIYIHLAPMILPVINATGVEQLVTLQIVVEVKDMETADTIHSKMPKVVDSLMRHLYGGLARGTLKDGKMVDVVRVKSNATMAINEVIGNDSVEKCTCPRRRPKNVIGFCNPASAML